MLKQSILNYEVEMIDYHSEGLSKPDTSKNHQYTEWQLVQKISQIVDPKSVMIRWIGNHESSYLDAFVYVLLTLSLKRQTLILRLKQKIYSLAKKYLQKSSQKLLVQFLCLIQYTQDKYSFLRKYPDVAKMIVSVLKYEQNEIFKKGNIKMQNFILESPAKEVRKSSFSLLCSELSFITFTQPNEFTYKFKCEGQVIYLITQKDCFFIIEKQHGQNQSQQKQINSTIKHLKNSTPRFCGSNSPVNKYRSQKKKTNHLVHKNKKSQNLLDHYNDSSQDCSIEQIHRSLKNDQQEALPHRKLEFDYRIKTENSLEQRRVPKWIKNKAAFKENNVNSVTFFNRLKDFQQKRKQYWKRLESEYYQKKNEIRKRIKEQKTKKSNMSGLRLFSTKHQGQQSQKERKKSFNSFTGHLIKDHFDSDFGESQFDAKSISKSEAKKNIQIVKKQKNLRKQTPEVAKKMLKKKNKNRLSVIQEENRLKFWNPQNKSHTQHKSPKFTSMNSSNRETLDANVYVTFNYLNKNKQIPVSLPSSCMNLNKIQYCASPIRV